MSDQAAEPVIRRFGSADWKCLCGSPFRDGKPLRPYATDRCSCGRSWQWQKGKRALALIDEPRVYRFGDQAFDPSTELLTVRVPLACIGGLSKEHPGYGPTRYEMQVYLGPAGQRHPQAVPMEVSEWLFEQIEKALARKTEEG